MMNGILRSASMLFVLAASAAAQDGGKIAWKGKEKNDDVKALMAQAQKEGKAIMMFFTSEG